MIFFNFENSVVCVNSLYSDLNLADDCFNASNTNLCCDCRLDFKSMLILSCSKLLQVSI